jgi:hypothetical protein
MKLEPLMTLHATIGDRFAVGEGGTGDRVVANVTGGRFEGPRLRGRVQNSGADWMLRDANGYGRLDVRLVLTTDDGAHIYTSYQGLLQYSEATVRGITVGPPTEFGDTYFATQLRFEAGDERYRWLNQIVAVGEGRLHPSAVEYRIYAVVPSAS